MSAIRTVDDHTELANIGSNTHAQIDTHISAANGYVKRDGSLALTADWDIGDGRKVQADEIRARDAAGLKLYDDANNGIFVEDGGHVGIGTSSPVCPLEIPGDTDNSSGKFGSFELQSYSVNNCWLTDNVYRSSSGFKYRSNGEGLFFYFYNGGFQVRTVPTGTAGNPATLTTRFRVENDGKVGAGPNTPTCSLDVDGNKIRLRTSRTPASAGAAGNTGDMSWDADYIYVCTATNTWKRSALSTW